MKRNLLLFMLLWFSFMGYSQNLLQDSNRSLEQEAREVAERWTKELAMTAKQTALMEDKLVEYALKKNVILQSKMREEAKTEELLRLQLAENKSMSDILTKPQYERYLFLLEQEVERTQPSKPKKKKAEEI